MRWLTSRRLVAALLLSWSAVILATPIAFGQDAAPAATDDKPADDTPAPAPATAADFAALADEWDALHNKLRDVSDKYRKAFGSAERKKIIEEEYKPLVAQSSALLPRLRQAAVAKIGEGADERAAEILLGMAADAERRDEYEQALELTGLLAGKTDNPALHYIAGMSAYATDDFDTAEQELKLANEARLLAPQQQQQLAGIPELKEAWAAEQALRAKEAEADDLPRVRIETNKGTIVVELFENEAPQAVANFVSLVRSKFYDGLTFHRVLGGFMAQGGCPEGTGTGGPGYKIFCECEQPNFRHHFRGTLSMAHAGKNTGGSQFFLTFLPTPSLDGRHTAFGRVIEGFDVLAKIQRRDPTLSGQPAPDKIIKAEVVRAREHDYEPTKVPPT